MMTNPISERFEEANGLSQQSSETDFYLVDASMGNSEWATKEPQALKAFDESLAEFGRLYAELAKC